MNRFALLSLAFASLLSAVPAWAVTLPSGEVVITQAAAQAGSVTPGDTPGFPVTISVGGSYRLASNLIVSTAVNGIEVKANEVTIDMGGFTLAGSGAGRNGITSFNRALRVEHGNIRGFTNDGIRSIAQFLTVADMTITANGRYGVLADINLGDDDKVAFARIVGSTVTANVGTGIACGDNCRVENTIVSKNREHGIYFNGFGGLALGNTVTSNHVGIEFNLTGGAGNNTVVANITNQILGSYIPMQPNACSPACPSPP